MLGYELSYTATASMRAGRPRYPSILNICYRQVFFGRFLGDLVYCMDSGHDAFERLGTPPYDYGVCSCRLDLRILNGKAQGSCTPDELSGLCVVWCHVILGVGSFSNQRGTRSNPRLTLTLTSCHRTLLSSPSLPSLSAFQLHSIYSVKCLLLPRKLLRSPP